MTKNRRFPFESTKETLSLEHFFTNETQLYPMIRQYASICRKNDSKKPRPTRTNLILPNEENDRLTHFMNQLKENKENPCVNINDLSDLRQNHVQYWKTVRFQWQTFYRDETRGII